MAHQAQYESGRAMEADDLYDNRTGEPAFAKSFRIGLLKPPLESGIIGRSRVACAERS